MLNNEAGASFSIINDSQIYTSGGSPAGGTIDNQGTFAKTAGTGNSVVSIYDNSGAVAFDQSGSGTVRPQSGTLSLNGGGVIFRDVVQPGSPPGPRSRSAAAHSRSRVSTPAAPARSPVNGARRHLHQRPDRSATLNISSGTLTINGASTVATLDHVRRHPQRHRHAHRHGTTTWTGGTMSGTGTTNADGGLTIGGTADQHHYEEYLSGWTLDNYGAATLAGTYDNSGLFFTGGAALNNEAGASFSIINDRRSGPTAARPAGGTINEPGDLRQDRRHRQQRRGHVTTTAGAVAFDQSGSGTVAAESGTLTSNGGGTFSGRASQPISAAADHAGLHGGTFTIAAANVGGSRHR